MFLIFKHIIKKNHLYRPYFSDNSIKKTNPSQNLTYRQRIQAATPLYSQ